MKRFQSEASVRVELQPAAGERRPGWFPSAPDRSSAPAASDFAPSVPGSELKATAKISVGRGGVS